MKLTILQEDLNKALQIASRFTSPKVQLPVLANVMLSTEKNVLHIAATNLEISVSGKIGAEVEEEGKITIPARTLTDIISNLSKGKVELIGEGETLKIKSKGFSGKLTGMNADDFPVIPKTLGKNSFTLSAKDLSNALSSVLFAVSADESRPLLTGVLWIFENKKLTLVATDGFRLSQLPIDADVEQNARIIVPKGILQEVVRLKEEEKEIHLSYTKEENQLICQIGNTVFSSRLIDGEFPPFEKIIPKDANISITVGKSDFLRSVKIASVFARDSANVVKGKIVKEEGKEGSLPANWLGAFEISAESSAKGNQSTTVEAEISSPIADFTIAFNCKFLEDYLNGVVGEEIIIEIVDENTASIFKDPANPNFLHIIMPIRLQN